MDDILLTCKASVYNYTKVDWFWISLNYSEAVLVSNITGGFNNNNFMMFKRLLLTSFSSFINLDYTRKINVKSTNYSHTSELHLTPARIEHSGYYSCRAEELSTFRSEEKTIVLNIQSKLFLLTLNTKNKINNFNLFFSY